MSEMDEVISEFLVESYENLDQLDRDLLALEDDPDDRAVLGSVFRTIHTVKGTCGFLGFEKLERLAHAGESLLSKLRDGTLRLTPEMADTLLALSDAVRASLEEIERTSGEGDTDYSTLTATLARLNDGLPTAAPERAEPEAAEPEAAEPQPELEPELEGVPVEAVHVEAVLVEAPPAGVEPVPPTIHQEAPAVTTAPASVDEPVSAERPNNDRGSVADSTVRVDVRLLDNLMTLVGELVLARNQVVQLVSDQDDAVLSATSQRLSLITTELQETAMKTRMQPISNIWSKLPRVVRDLATACGKSVRVEMVGEDTELDKTIIESIKDPLTHLVRNSVDHGVETPDVRAASGKVPEGRLMLRAFHEGGQVNIEISDDGAGLDAERIRAKAIERGLLTQDQAASLSERELAHLIFEPGFSTAERVTNVSGRGVGMDVVRTNIERIGGSVDVSSAAGEGTTFRIKIPLTLAIIPALVVTAGNDCFAIPQINLLELVRLDGAEARTAIELLHGTPVYRLRGKLLPILHLHEQLELERMADDDTINIVVLQADDRAFGLVVDGVRDSSEIVVKPLGNHLKGISSFAGATILGDGSVALILDVMGLAQKAHVITENRDRSLLDTDEDHEVTTEGSTPALLLRTADDGRMAIPLALVDRLEELSPASVEHAGDAEVVQYRGEVMPLVALSRILPERRAVPRTAADAADSDVLQVVVVRHAGRSIGLVVDRVLDITSHPDVLEPGGRVGVAGTAVLSGRVTEVIDLPAVLALAGISGSVAQINGAAAPLAVGALAS